MAKEMIWESRNKCGSIIDGFDYYAFDTTNIYIHQGFLNTMDIEYPLRRIKHIDVQRNLWQMLFGCGTLVLTIEGHSDSHVTLADIQDPINVMHTMRRYVENERDKWYKRRVGPKNARRDWDAYVRI